MNLRLRIWRQKKASAVGKFETHEASGVLPDMSFLEMLDVVNEGLTANGKELGQTPLVIEEVKPGEATYELRLSGYKSTSVKGKVEPQQQAFLAARLEKSVGPEPGQPFINSLGMKLVPVGDVRISVLETRVQDYETFSRARSISTFGQTICC